MLTELAYSDQKNGPVEQRRLKRWQLVNYLRVFDAVSGDLLGHLMDLTEEGIMLLSNETLPCGQKFQLRMERLSEGTFSNIRLTAKSLWSKPDQDPHFYNTGFSLLDPSKETLAALQELIDELKHGSDHDSHEPADNTAQTNPEQA